MTDLFVEIFPLEPDAAATLAAYRLQLEGDLEPGGRNRLGQRLARRLQRTFPGMWLWIEERIITDSERNPVELMITLDILRTERPATYAPLREITLDAGWQPSPRALADASLRGRLRDPELAAAMQAALDQQKTTIHNAQVQREYRLRAWTVADQPAISISIASRLLYHQTVHQYIRLESDRAALNDRLAGLWAQERGGSLRGEITGVTGNVGVERERLLAAAKDRREREQIERAPDSEWVIAIRAGQEEREFPAGALRLIVRLGDVPRFDVRPAQVLPALQMLPAARARLVKTVSDIVKDAGLIGNAYNSRTHPDLFFSADFEMNLRFAENRVRAYDAASLRYDFTQCGVYRLRERFRRQPIRVCVVNALSFPVEDFVEAMERQLERDFDFAVEVIRERRIRVISRPNIESAVRVVEKEDPDIILTFFPDEADSGSDESGDEGGADDTAAYIRSLTLGRGIPNHLISETTLNDPEAMPAIIMAMLGKTGSSPFVLAEPLEGIDNVVGLSFVRQTFKTLDEIRLTAIARIYREDGEFARYAVRELTLEEEVPPYVLLRDLFPQREFSGKRVLLHHDGPLADDLLTALTRWGQAIRATFQPVEIVRFGAPRIYATGEKGVSQPPWGSAFKLSATEALLISSLPAADVTPQPLHIRAVGPAPLEIETALRSVLVWTLLAYGAERLPKLPVTVMNADQLAYWLGRGGSLSAEDGAAVGEVPFWL